MATPAPTPPFNYTKTRTQLTDVQIAQVAYNAGFRGEALITAIAVALRESGGNATALNDNGEFSVGLWQINVRGYLAERLTRWGLSSWTALWTPSVNARAAWLVSGGGRNWTPWSAYNRGSYRRHIPRATAAARQIDPTMPDVNVGGTDSRARDLILWFSSNPLSGNVLTSWTNIIAEVRQTRPDLADYLQSVLTSLEIDPTQNWNRETFVRLNDYLVSQAGGDPNSIFGPLFEFVRPIIGDIAHGFYFLIFVIVGLVIMVIALKARKGGDET